MKFLKSTGITRKIDELGRVVIPKEIRRNLGIRDGESLEIYTDEDSIILKKHSQIEKYEDLGIKLSGMIAAIFKIDVIITDREKVIAATNNPDLVNKLVNKDLIYLIDNREELIGKENKTIYFDDMAINGFFTIVPIIASIDSLGLIILVTKDVSDNTNLARLMAKILADKVNIY